MITSTPRPGSPRIIRVATPARRVLAMLVAAALLFLGFGTAPAHAEGMGTIVKGLDSVQGGGFTAPNTFQTGALVRYSLKISCSSNTTDCGASTITDELDPSLEYVGIVQPTQNTTPTIPVSASATGQTVTIHVGTAAVPWPDANKLNIVLIARVRNTATGTIPNQASITTNGGTSLSNQVDIRTPAATAKWYVTKSARPTSVAPGETSTYHVSFATPSGYGNLGVTGFTVTDTLPVGVEIVDADGGVVSGNVTTGYTITWTSSTALTVSAGTCDLSTATPTSACSASNWSKDVKVSFPAGTFTGGERTVNNVSADIAYADGSTHTSTASATVTVVAPVYESFLAKGGPATALAGDTVTWTLQGHNDGNTTVANWTMVDELPAGLTNYRIVNQYGPPYMPVTGTQTKVTIDYRDASGTWHSLLVWNPGDPRISNLAIPAGATAVRFEAASLAPGSFLYNQIAADIPTDATIGTAYQNCATLAAPNETPKRSCVTTTVAAPFTKIDVYKEANLGGETSVRPGDTFWFVLGVEKSAGQALSTIDLADTLPTAFEYVPGSACGNAAIPTTATPNLNTVPTGYYGGCTLSIPDPTITPSVPTSATSLLQWLDLPVPVGARDGSHYFVVAFQVRVKEGTAIANYTNHDYVNVPGVTTVCGADGYYGQQQTTEPGVDFNGNGTVDDLLCSNVETVQVREAAIASAFKWVKGDVGTNVFESTGTISPSSTDTVTSCPDAFGGYTRYPCVAEVNPSGTFEYKIDLVNQGNLPLTDYTLYDILPHIGDVGVNQVLATSPRKSEWTPQLAGPVSPAGVPEAAHAVVLYNLSYDPCRPELSAPTAGSNWQGAACADPTGGTNVQNTWYTQAQVEAMAGSWANVKSFKIQLYTDVAVAADGWAPGVHYYVDVPMEAPQNAPASSIPGVNAGGLDLSAAWNSLADQVSAINPASGEVLPQLAAAPRKVGIIVPAKPQVQVGDYVWIDKNGDGLQDAKDKPLEGVVLTLTGPSGQPVTDVFGNPVGVQTTDANGYYLFPNLPVLAAGEHYTVTIDQVVSATALTGLEPTAEHAGSDPAKDSSTWTATSTDLTTDGAKDLTLDFGFVEKPTVSVGDYVWLDTNRDGLQSAGEKPIEGVTVQLVKAGVKVDETTTDADGYYSFTGLDSSTEYTLTFVAPDGHTFTAANAGGVTSNDPTGDNGTTALDGTTGGDSDAVPAADGKTGSVTFTTPASGADKPSSLADKTVADNPGLDAGFVTQFNLKLTKTLTTAGPFRLGQTVTYTLTPSNDGPMDALAGWSVTDLLPNGLILLSMTGTGYDCSTTPGTCVSSEPLAAKATGSPITVTATIDGAALGALRNVAYVSPSADDVTETVPLVIPTLSTDTTTPVTDNDAEASLTVAPLVSVGDYVWYDTNRDGVQQATEAPYAGMTVRLYAGTDTSGAPLRTTTTNASGYYWFLDLEASTQYTIVFVKQATESFTTQNAAGDGSNSATSDLTDSDADLNTGAVTFTTPDTGRNAPTTIINNNLQVYADNPGIDAGIVSYNLKLTKALTTAGPFRLGQTVTYALTPHNDGPALALAGWSVSDLLPSGLTLVSMTGTGYDCSATPGTCVASAPLAPMSDGPVITVIATIDSAALGTLKNVAYVSPAADDVTETVPLITPDLTTDTTDENTDNDAEASLTVAPLVSIGDYVWYDVNRNGLQDADETPYAGMTVNLYAADGTTLVATTTTSSTGYYSFTGLEASTSYVVEFLKGADETFTTMDSTAAGSTDANDSDANLTTGRVTVTTKATGANLASNGTDVWADDPTIDAGVISYNLQLTKTLVPTGPYHQGSTVTFTLTPSNDGPVQALAGWSVTEIMPAGLTLVSMSGDGYACTISTATCVAGAPLAAGTSGNPITVKATVNAAFVGSAHNVAYVSPSADDVTETNPLVVPDDTTDTAATATDNDAQAELVVRADTLPQTGTDAQLGLLVAAGALVLGGGGLLLVARRRKARP